MQAGCNTLATGLHTVTTGVCRKAYLDGFGRETESAFIMKSLRFLAIAALGVLL
jgi:hypothetical protein